ncbi:MAG: hypothetical protein A7316_03170 [Candidatus Altiarchaeales archaeon WOR_SM1_86-2]|nr:MAG: hypothetical protein A7316_03170 [Candidatus Altiarchaeales archaeon WOR_SM1_86-2]ODS41493.1 MAG: hypothetical protein A7315_15090 [Candidatus Altiarchaeales archaeon WOR_SM1_79]
MNEYDFEIEKILKEIKENNARLVGLQFPEGLKKHAVRIAEIIEEKTKAKAVIFTDPTYGACDTKNVQGEMLDLDLIVHFGHSELIKTTF